MGLAFEDPNWQYCDWPLCSLVLGGVYSLTGQQHGSKEVHEPSVTHN